MTSLGFICIHFSAKYACIVENFWSFYICDCLSNHKLFKNVCSTELNSVLDYCLCTE